MKNVFKYTFFSFFLIFFLFSSFFNVSAFTLNTDLLSYWKLDESSGDASDVVGSNTATNVGTTPFASAKINNGSSHNGSSQYFTLTDIGGNTNFTVNLWAKASASPTTGDDTMISTNDVMMILSGTSLYIQVWVDRNGTTGTNKVKYASVSVDTITNWHMYTISANDTSYKVYIDGVDQNASFTFDSPSRSFASSRIGNARQTSGTPVEKDFFAGMLDEIGYWTRELVSYEISSLYLDGSGDQYPFSNEKVLTDIKYYVNKQDGFILKASSTSPFYYEWVDSDSSGSGLDEDDVIAIIKENMSSTTEAINIGNLSLTYWFGLIIFILSIIFFGFIFNTVKNKKI